MTSPYLTRSPRVRLSHDGLAELARNFEALVPPANRWAQDFLGDFLMAARQRMSDDSAFNQAPEGEFVQALKAGPPHGEMAALDWPPDVDDHDDRRIEALVILVLLLACLGLWKVVELSIAGIGLARTTWGI